jgi:hypothetical protein
MTAPTLYGQAQSEKRAEENAVCRQIVREINNFGVSQRQALLVIHLLASELENIEHMRAITKLVRELGGDDLFLIGAPQPDSEVNGGDDGTSNV